MSALTWDQAVVELAPALSQLEDFPVPPGIDHEVCAACRDVECTGRCDLALWIVRQVIEDVKVCDAETVDEIVEEIEHCKRASGYRS